jgi:hypothetical protein
MLMREKAVLVDGIVLIVLAVVITGLLEAPDPRFADLVRRMACRNDSLHPSSFAWPAHTLSRRIVLKPLRMSACNLLILLANNSLIGLPTNSDFGTIG